MELVPTKGKYASEGLGLIAAAEKRRAEFCFLTIRNPEQHQEGIARLRRAMDTYSQAFVTAVRGNERAADTGQLNWAITQELSLAALLEGGFSDERWATANELSRAELHGTTPHWAHTSLLELALLRWWIKGVDQSKELEQATAELIALTLEQRFALRSTERQLRRYLDWWWKPGAFGDALHVKAVPAELRAKVQEIAERLGEQSKRGPRTAP